MVSYTKHALLSAAVLTRNFDSMERESLKIPENHCWMKKLLRSNFLVEPFSVAHSQRQNSPHLNFLHKELTFKLKSRPIVCPVIIVFEAVCHAEFNCIIIKIFRFSLPRAITLGIDGLFSETFCLVRDLSSRAVFSKTNFTHSQV